MLTLKQHPSFLSLCCIKSSFYATRRKSEDTLLMMLKEIYGSMGVISDVKATPQGLPTSTSFDSQLSRSSYATPPFSPSSLVPPSAVPMLSSQDPPSSANTHAPLPPPPATAVPMLSSQISHHQHPPPPSSSAAVALLPPPLILPCSSAPPPLQPTANPPAVARVLGGRPLSDPSLVPHQLGMDPTAQPHLPGGALPPPPTSSQIPSFNRRKGGRR